MLALEVAGNLPAIALASLAILLVLCILYPNRSPGTHARRDLPQIPGALPILGNVAELVKISSKPHGFVEKLLEWQRELAPEGTPLTLTVPASLAPFGGRVTLINRPEYIEYVQKTNFDNYPKGPAFREAFHDVLHRDGIFAADGMIWKRQRKLASNIFSANNFRTHVQSAVHKELKTFDSLLLALAANGQSVNLPGLFFRFTLASFADMAFGANLDCLTADPASLAHEVAFASAFDKAQVRMFERFLDPTWKFGEYLMPIGRRMQQYVKTLHETCLEIIDLRLANLEKSAGNAVAASSKDGKDLLQLFIDQGFGRDELVPVVLNFMIAGRDTTAQALAWAFLMLRKHPDVYQKCRQEARAVLGVGAHTRLLEYDDLKAIPYTHAVFYETLRLYPSVPANNKRCLRDDVIRGGPDLPDVPIQAGTSVMWSDWVMGRMPQVWGDDCLEFKPERFLTTQSDGSHTLRPYSPFQFHAFNGGPRLCLGQTLASYEGCAVIAAICNKYDLQFDDDALLKDPPVGSNSLTLPMYNPYEVVVNVAPK